MSHFAPPSHLYRCLLLAVGAFAADAWAEGESQAAPALEDSLAGALFDTAAAPEGEGEPPQPGSVESDAVARFLEANRTPVWARAELEAWADANAGAIAAAQAAPSVPMTIGQLADEVRAQAQQLLGPQQGGASAVLAGPPGDGAPKQQGGPRFIVRRPQKDQFVRRSADPGGPVGVFSASGPTPDLEFYLPLRLRSLGPEGFEFTCGAMAAQGHLRLRAYVGTPIVIEYDLHIEHALPNLFAVIVGDPDQNNLLALPAGPGPFDYTFTGAEIAQVAEGAWLFLVEQGEPADEHILALGPIYDHAMAVECPAELTDAGQNTVSRPMNFFFDPKNIDLMVMGNDLPVGSELPADFRLHGHSGSVVYEAGEIVGPHFFRYLDKDELAPLWGPAGFDYAALAYDNVNGAPLTLTGVPECPYPTGDVVLCEFLLTGDGAGTPLQEEIPGGLMLLFHPLGVSVSLHMDLAGIAGAQAVRLRNADDEITFEAPVLGPRFDYIFNPCEIGLLEAATVELATAQYPGGAYAGAPSCAEAGGDARYRPGCETAFTLRIEDPSSRAIKALSATVQLPYGWKLLETTAANGVTGAPAALPGLRPAPNAEGRLEFAWLDAPAFPHELTLRLQPLGAPGGGAIGARYLTYHLEYREAGRPRLSPVHTVRLFADYPEPEGEGDGEGEGAAEGEGEGAPAYPCDDFAAVNQVDPSLDDAQDAPGFGGANSGGGEGEGQAQPPAPPADFHSADYNQDHKIDLAEILRIIQFYNSGGFHCQAGTEDGYAPGHDNTKQACAKHASDYAPQDFDINLSEILRLIQIYNSAGYFPTLLGEDGYGIKISSIQLKDTDHVVSCDQGPVEFTFAPVTP